MKIISIDLETSGLDKNNEGNAVILQFAAVLEDTCNVLPIEQLPKFSYFAWHPKIVGEPFALNMNAWILKILADYETEMRNTRQQKYSAIVWPIGSSINPPANNLCEFVGPIWQMVDTFVAWYTTVTGNPPSVVNVAGKNFATFDKVFLDKLAGWKDKVRIRQRIIDPAILFTDWKTDDAIPGLAACKQRAGISGEVTHNAVDDAIGVIKTLRTQYTS